MNYQEFVNSVTGFLRESMPYGTKFDLVPLQKNNGVIMDGLSVRRQGQRAAPTIYLEAYYKDYLAGRSLRGICDQILECCEDDSFEKNLDTDFFKDYAKIRPTVAYKLINREKNTELLQEVPHLPFLDLAIVFYSILADTSVGNATVLIRTSHIERWGIGVSELYRAAKGNVRKLLPECVGTMASVLAELSGGLDQPEETGVPMYVLTNERRNYGAACMIYDGLLEECAQKLGGSFYLLPSSIHEMILLPASGVDEPAQLVEMVRDINRTQVRSTEVLSDNVYLYAADSRQITVIGE